MSDFKRINRRNFLGAAAVTTLPALFQAAWAQRSVNPTGPSFGSRQVKVEVVEFVDYNCGYCVKARSFVKGLPNLGEGVRVYLQDYPILSDFSTVAAKAALAARKQNKYFAMHDRMLKYKYRFTQDAVEELADDEGLQMAKFRSDMNSSSVASALSRSKSLGRRLGVSGTPGFVINGKLISGLAKDKITSEIQSYL